MFIEILTALAIVAPFALWLQWRKTVRTLHVGQASINWLHKSDINKGVCYAFFAVPGVKDQVMTKISESRYNTGLLFTSHDVVVKQRMFSEPWVEQITWSDGTTDAPEKPFDGLYLGGYYLILGMLVAVAAAQFNWGHVGLFAAALTLALGGASINLFRFRKGETDAAPIRLLWFINVGKGVAGLSIAALLLAAVTAACFWQVSFFTLFPGINCAFELGSITALLIASRRADKVEVAA